MPRQQYTASSVEVMQCRRGRFWGGSEVEFAPREGKNPPWKREAG